MMMKVANLCLMMSLLINIIPRIRIKYMLMIMKWRMNMKVTNLFTSLNSSNTWYLTKRIL